MVVFPNAKINLGLRITGKRADGFHSIESVFYPVALSDSLEIVPADEGGTTFQSYGIDIPADGKPNLVERAVALCLSTYDKTATAPSRKDWAIHLAKHIPIGAGLGGGSADAAFAIRLINDMAKLNFDNIQMENIAAQIGSDCPFFVDNQPKYVIGRGEVMESFQHVLSEKYIVLVYPNIHISTKEAYAGISPQQPNSDLREILNSPIGNWKEHLINDFEAPIIQNHPAIGEIKHKLYDKGAQYASMTGSGSAVFGVFEALPDLAEEFGERFYWQGKA